VGEGKVMATASKTGSSADAALRIKHNIVFCFLSSALELHVWCVNI